ncbi:MAG: hypothetical protein WDO16_03670 [Bacteroidota bacterium]
MISLFLLISWVTAFFIFQAGFATHTLIVLSILFCLQAIILTKPEKVRTELE